MKKLFAYIPLAGMILLFLAACAGASTGTSDPLDGTSWELWAFRKTKPIPGTTFTATFEDGQVRGSAGCNSYGGSYQIDGDRIFVGEMVSTEMACLDPEGLMEQESYLLEFLGDAQTFQVDEEQLQIFRSDGEALTFQPQE